MQENQPFSTSNILPCVKANIPGESGINRARHMGRLVLSHLNEELLYPDKFAKTVLEAILSHAQPRVLRICAGSTLCRGTREH